MAKNFRPRLPITSIEELMDHDLENEGGRELYRRYRKGRSFAGPRIPHEAQRIPGLERVFDAEQTEALKEDPGYFSRGQDDLQGMQGTSFRVGSPDRSRKIFSLAGSRWPAIQVKRLSSEDEGTVSLKERSIPQASTPSVKLVKQEPEEVSDSGETSFARFASIVDSALQGLISFPDLIRQFEVCCEDLAEHVREEAMERHRVLEDRLMRQKAQMLHGESATWSLLWYLYGKGSDEAELDDGVMFPSTSQQEACRFIMEDQTARTCLRIVQWLEGLASKALDLEKKHKGWFAGSYLQKLGVWHQTQRAIRKKAGNALLIQHLDPDAPTREQARLQYEDQKLEEGLLEDVWKLLRAGRLEEARQLCRSSGQPWRAATLGGCGDLGPSSSVESWMSKGKDRSLQAVELESGLGHQRRLWKWACFCASEKIAENTDEDRHEAAVYAAQCGNIRRMLPVCRDWESACWAIVKSWLNVQVDLELARLHPANLNRAKPNGAASEMSDAIGDVNMETPTGPDAWPEHVVDQQPHDLPALFQKLHSGDLVHENVSRSCKDQQHQVQMSIMLDDVAHLLDLLRAWIVPPQEGLDLSRPHGHPQMVRFGAHLVLVLRHILADDVKEQFREKLWLTGDLILNTYAIFLFTQRREDLVGVYASQLAPYLCEELYVHMMELRQNDSIIVRYKIFRSVVEYLPYSSEDSAKGCVSNVLDRVFSRSREVKLGIRRVKFEEPEERFRLESQQKATPVQWLCFVPPSTLSNAEQLRAVLLARALQHSNVLFREFALVSLWRTFKMPVGAHMLLGYLAEPFKEPPEVLLSLDQYNVQENLHEFEDWREYYACDAFYRKWLKIEVANGDVPADQLSSEEKERAFMAARQALSSAAALLQGKGHRWLVGIESATEDPLVTEWLELQAVASFTSSSGLCLVPDATVCTALTSAFYCCAGDDATVLRQLVAEVCINGVDENCINVSLRCLPVKGDGFGHCAGSEGGLLAGIMAAAIKGELEHFQVGLALEVSRVDAWFVDKDGEQIAAAYILQGLCRRCCLPELILRCMQMRVSLVGQDSLLDDDIDLVELIASSDCELHRIFSRRQLEEFLLFEREYILRMMEIAESEHTTESPME